MKKQAHKLEDPGWLEGTKHKRIVLTVPDMEQVGVSKNLTYKKASGRDLQTDVYLPPDLPEGETRPGVVFIHGGYLPPNLLTQPKDWGIFTSYGQLLAASGFTAVTFNHRYYGADFLETARGDIADLISYLREHGQQLGLDPSCLNLWTFSGGGSLIGWVLRDAPNYIRSLVLYYALLDQQPREGGPEIPERTRLDFSPLHQLQKATDDIFPILIARAGLDRPALNQTIDRFIQTALSKNVTIEISNHANGQHGFDILDPDERSRQIICRTIDFIRAQNERRNKP